mmetsp:Transcript_12282/g.37478  ORF Transcript_12282/g.37478 Transcript_12282/m.37478 type:complete len:523 (-) Transcript_12282:1208-2776(-)
MGEMDANLEKRHDIVLILDFGSQYSHLIARRVRDAGVFCELVAHDTPREKIAAMNPKGLILSGGPASVYEPGAPHVAEGVLDLGVPVLGICYGLQEMTRALGGTVIAHDKKEFGHATVTVKEAGKKRLLAGLNNEFRVWMSHGDKIASLPKGFTDVAYTSNTEHAAVANEEKKLYGLQFHPEVTHTAHGTEVLKNFARNICNCSGDWSMKDFVEETTEEIRKAVGKGLVIGAVSGGVDSTVAAVLMKHAIGDQFEAIFVNNGVLRKDEEEEVQTRLRDKCHVHLKYVDASEEFLSKLEGVVEPETKRKIIGNTFIEVFEREAKSTGAEFLLQGTLYPDVIESVSHKGPSATIKTHHNVGGLPERMNLKLIEPLRLLFKDEVRKLGLILGIERESIMRHPFPGPGLSIRILGEISRERLRVLKEADAIFISELRQAGLYEKIGQAFAVLLPCKAVGVMGDFRTYEEVIALRAVETTDYMTADWSDLPHKFLLRVSTRIVNEIRGVNRVCYDITSKPPGTIEWE